jgi:DNA repair exonuclease SbcCD ATPase subunit
MSPLSLPWKLIAEIVAAAALFAAITFGIHRFLEHEREIGREEVRAEYQQKLLEATQAAKAKEEADAKRLQEAQNAYAKAQETIRSLAAANVAASNSLRDTTASISKRLPELSADALRDLARAYGNVLDKCSAEYSRLAERTEVINAEKRKLMESWPKPSSDSSSNPNN